MAREKPEVFAEHTWPSLVGLPTCGAAVLGEAEASRLLPELDSEVAVANGRRAAVGEAVGDAAPFTTLRNGEMQGVRDGAESSNTWARVMAFRRRPRLKCKQLEDFAVLLRSPGRHVVGAPFADHAGKHGGGGCDGGLLGA